MVFERTRAEFAQRHYRAAISHYKFTPLEFGNGHTSFAPVANRRHSGLRHLNPEAKRQDYEIKNRLPPDPPVFVRSFAEPRVSLEIELHRRPGSAGSRYLMPQIYPKTRPVSHVEKERRVLHEEIRVLVEGAVIGVRVDNQLRASSSRR